MERHTLGRRGPPAADRDGNAAARQPGTLRGPRGAQGIVIRHAAHAAPEQSPEMPAAAANDAPARPAKRRVVEVRDLQAERARRVFPCLDAQRNYTGCIGFERCTLLCWSPRERERQAVMRVSKPTGAPCRTCAFAREVSGDVAVIDGREVRLVECRLGFWHGRAPISDFVQGKIPIDVRLPCPGFCETDAVLAVIKRARLHKRAPL